MAFFFILLCSSAGFATDGLFTGIHHQYQSPRALGMGDAFVAVANDYSSIFYNPAGLARLDEGQINLSIDFALSPDYLTFNSDIQSASKKSGDSAKAQAYAELLQKNYGKPYSIRTGLLEGVFVRPGWGFAVLPMDFTLDMAIHNQAAPAISARAYADTTIAYGVGHDFHNDGLGGKLSWGVTGKFVNRGYFSKDVNTLDLVADSEVVKKSDLREGYTLDADVGLLYTPYLPTTGVLSSLRLARPTFGAVVRNVAETGFSQSLNLYKTKQYGGDAPEKLYRVLDVGTRWEYPSFWIFSGRGSMDMRDIGDPNFNLRRGFHAGLEFDWTLFSWWKGQYRGGVNEGYPTLGASFLFTLFRLDLVTYGEDVGTEDSPVENRMYMVKLNIDI